MSVCFITTEIKEGLSPMSQEQGLGMRKICLEILETMFMKISSAHTRIHTHTHAQQLTGGTNNNKEGIDKLEGKAEALKGGRKKRERAG